MRFDDHGYANEEETHRAAAQAAKLMDHLVKGPMTPSEVQDLMLAFNK